MPIALWSDTDKDKQQNTPAKQPTATKTPVTPRGPGISLWSDTKPAAAPTFNLTKPIQNSTAAQLTGNKDKPDNLQKIISNVVTPQTDSPFKAKPQPSLVFDAGDKFDPKGYTANESAARSSSILNPQSNPFGSATPSQSKNNTPANESVSKFLNTYETNTILGKALNVSNPSQYAAKQQINDQYSKDHPVLHSVANGLSTITDLIYLDKAGAGFGIADKSLSAGKGIESLYPTASRIVAKGLESGTVFAIKDALNEALDQSITKQPNASKLVSTTGKGFVSGAALGGAGGFNTLPKQVGAAVLGSAALSTTEKLIQNKKLTGNDLVDIGIDSAVAGLFQAASGYGSADKIKADDLARFQHNKLVTDIQSRSGGTRQEAEHVAILMQNLPGQVSGIQQRIVQILDEVPATFKELPTKEQSVVISKVSEQVKNGASVKDAIQNILGSGPSIGFQMGGSAQAPTLREQLGVDTSALVPKEAPIVPMHEQLGLNVLPAATAQAPTLREQLQEQQSPIVQPSTSTTITPATPEVTKKIIETPTEAELAQQKEDKILSQQGVVNPGAALEDIKASIEKLKEGAKDARAGEALRTKYVGNEGARVVKDNHLFDDVQKLVKNPLEQEALTLFRNFKDNLPELQQMLDGTHPAYQESIDFFKEHNPGATEADITAFKKSAVKDVNKFIKPIQLALNPSEGLLKADKAYTEFAKTHLEEGQKLDFLDSKIKPENYVHQITNPKSKPRGFSGRTAKGKMGGSFTASMERKFQTPLHAVIAGATPKTLNAVDLGRIYAQKYAAKAATVEFLKELKDIQLANINGNNVPKDWEVVKIGQQKTVYLPKKIVDSLKPILENHTDIKVLDRLRFFQSFVKAGEVSASIFHLKALTLTASNSMGSKAFSKAMIEDKDSSRFREDEIDFVKSGGTTSEQGKTIEAYKLANQGTTISKFDALKSMPVLSHALAFSDALTYATFDIAQRKFKVNDFVLQRNAYLAKNPNATPEEIFNQKIAIAKDVNATYGGLNLDIIGTSRLARNISRILYFAPDWTYSNILKAKYVFTNKGARANAFKFFLRSAIVTLVLSQMMSMLIGKKLSKHPFRVYLGTDKNGKEMYSNWFAVGAFGDWVNEFSNVADQGLIGGTVKTVGNKLASIPRTAINQVNNKNFLGQTIRIKGASPVVNDIRSVQEIISENIPLPFGIIDSVKYAIDAQTARNFWDYVGVWLGGLTSHEIPEGNHVPTTGREKGKVVPDKPGQGSNREQNSIIDQIKTGKVYKK